MARSDKLYEERHANDDVNNVTQPRKLLREDGGIDKYENVRSGGWGWKATWDSGVAVRGLT